ncbi:hypothetical protein DVR09_00850 [Erythrobacter aureus]|uniref:Uncharacterized protein n=1 Tax=Erythrobacter aureus TaxID=2182384 RepID=A0A345YAW5_9SPHN|nr:hypothetical protein DVR09_00850 [Erythrobacter aureus]
MRGDRAQDGSGVSIFATLEKLQQTAGTGASSAAAFSRPGYDLTRMRHEFRGVVRPKTWTISGAYEKR